MATDFFGEKLLELDTKLNAFESETALKEKGIKLFETHNSLKEVKKIIDEQKGLMTKRKMQAELNPKQKKFECLEKSFLVDTQIDFYQMLQNNFIISLSQLIDNVDSTSAIESCIYQYNSLVKGYQDLRLLKPVFQKQQQTLNQFLMKLKDDITQFERQYQDQIQQFARLQKQKKVKIYDSFQNSSGEFLSENSSRGESIEIERNQQLHKIEELNQQKQILEQRLILKQSLIIEEECQEEMKQEVKNIAAQIMSINAVTVKIAQMVAEQGENIEEIKKETEDTLQEVVESQAQLEKASDQHKKYSSKLACVKGAAIGGGVGFFIGGPLGVAVGTAVGATVGKVISKVIF